MPNPVRMASISIAAGMLLMAGPAQTAQTPFEVANAALVAGEYRKAADLYAELVEQHPEWAPGLKALGQCQLFLGNLDEGKTILAKAHELDPAIDIFEAVYAVGQTLYSAHAYGEAVDPLTLALDLAPRPHRAALTQRTAYAALKAERYLDARRVLESSDNLDARGMRYLALACQKGGDYDCALTTLRKLRDAPQASSPDALRDLASWSHYWALKPDNAQRRDALLAAAIEDTRSWREAAPDEVEALRLHADVLLAAGRHAEVVELATRRTQRRPEDCAAWLVLARGLNQQRNAVEAEAAARKQLQCDPDSVDGRLELAAALMRQVGTDFSATATAQAELDRIAEADRIVERALALAPGNVRAVALARDLRTAAERLGSVVADLSEVDARNDEARREAEAQRIRDRCRTILWNLRDENRDLSAEDRAFNEVHNCKQYAGS